MAGVLVIDDNRLDRRIAADALRAAGFSVTEAPDGATGLHQLYEHRPELVLLDVMMPAMDGWTVCARIRELSEVPIILLTSLNREDDMIRGLDLGADDFVSKPISPRQLIARARAVLRRAHLQRPAKGEAVFDDGTLRIDSILHTVTLNGEPVALTPTEFRLLQQLAAHPGHLHTHGSLLNAVWGSEYVSDIDFLRVYIWRLRKKLADDPDTPRWIATERGLGYRFGEARPRG